jgi:hypothetical protein
VTISGIKSACRHDDNPCFFQDIQLNQVLKHPEQCRLLNEDLKIAAPNASALACLILWNVNFSMGLIVKASVIFNFLRNSVNNVVIDEPIFEHEMLFERSTLPLLCRRSAGFLMPNRHEDEAVIARRLKDQPIDLIRMPACPAYSGYLQSSSED